MWSDNRIPNPDPIPNLDGGLCCLVTLSGSESLFFTLLPQMCGLEAGMTRRFVD